MPSQSVKINKTLASLVSSISLTPSSWRGWSCIYIKTTNQVDFAEFSKATTTISSILDTFLDIIEGQVFYCADQSVHIFCKQTKHDIMSDISLYVCDVLADEARATTTSHIYDLSQSGREYSQKVFEQTALKPEISIEKSVSLSLVDNIYSLPPRPEKTLQQTLENPDIKKVLLVEDDKVTRWMVRKALKGSCHLATTPTANQSFLKILSFQPDLILLDINLPDQKGNSVLKWVKHNSPKTNVVMFSSQNDLETISQTLEEGASAFIAKPFLRQQLLDCINDIE
jgi:CheY-like chemotaxis protein